MGGSNTLTPKEIADGWLLLFDGETTFGWKALGDVKSADGVLALMGGQKTLTALAATTSFSEFELRFEYRHSHGDGPRPHDPLITWQPIPKDGKIEKIDGPYVKLIGPSSKNPSEWGTAYFKVVRKDDPNLVGRQADRLDYETRAFPKSDREEVGKQLPLALARHHNPTVIVSANQKLLLRNIKLRPLGLKSIFTGKDLAGWKEHPGKKSKFAVEQGAINVKDGPGDLQTESAWADFVLQLDCLSNGKQLNSGIFFRCIPGQYQQGYEAQIHNGWLAEPTREYTIEEYDPETGKVTKSEKLKSTAVDFGTGAIYRRVPARKAVATDGEWFTMTVVAQGRHLATWVNGLQVVDWTDTRKLNDNARNGCRLEKGPISIQGHDPTTDLSFRNIRIAELPAGAEKK